MLTAVVRRGVSLVMVLFTMPTVLLGLVLVVGRGGLDLLRLVLGTTTTEERSVTVVVVVEESCLEVKVGL
jgi:hypothetical protein